MRKPRPKGYFCLYNTFHDTKTRVYTDSGHITQSQVRRAKKTLCGADDCTCSNDAGMHGYTNPVLMMNADGSGYLSL